MDLALVRGTTEIVSLSALIRKLCLPAQG